MSMFDFSPVQKKQQKEIDYSDTDSLHESSSSSSSDDTSKEDLPRPILTNLDAYSSDFALPEMDQCIVRVTKIKRRDVVQIINDHGTKYSIPVRDRLLNRIKVKNYLLIQPTVQGSIDLVEIVRVIDRPYKRFYEANNVWPVKFVDSDMGIIGIVAAKETKKQKQEKLKAKKKKPSKPVVQALIPTGVKIAPKPKKKPVKGGEFEGVSESDSDDSENTRMEKRRKRLAIIGSDVIEPGNDNTTVTSAVVTSSRQAIVKDRDEMPPLPGGMLQPWKAILQQKQMSQKQQQKYVEKQMLKNMTKRMAHVPIIHNIDQDLPCGAVAGQIMTPWEDLIKRHKSYKHLDEVED